MELLTRDYKHTSGIYQIKQISSNKVYIGSAQDLYRRCKDHFRMLSNNNHDNQYLQNSWNCNGSKSFCFEVLELVSNINELLLREQYWLDKKKCYLRDTGYNISPTAGSTLGVRHSNDSKSKNSLAKRGVYASISEEAASNIKQMLNEGKGILYISQALSVNYDTVASIRKGRTFTYVEPQIDTIKLNFKNNLDPFKDVIEIKRLLNMGYKVKDLAEKFTVNYRTISSIKNNIIWRNVGEEIKIHRRRKRLTKQNVISIKRLIEQGLSNKEIAEKYNTLRSTISDIRRGHSWKHIN
ncbi:GIY-YIG nuclease family protein [Metabacillus elymi]|uniref:GIY-YIG nuclease family protein n=1 Tax=Metabacillus elymi TaxID=2745198 RepID=A0ABX6S9T9_9BACI|nr:GIY-YIG nuclease family protein [Metabacillus sp. KUDC1714]QNF29641.1 GIY-YIG nuclease family protein [Metabacillus sp. KUDC1714]